MIDLTVVGNKVLSKEDMFKLAIKQDDLGLLLETLKIQDVKNKEMIKAAKKAYSKALKKTNESAKAKKIKEALEWYDLARNINGKMDIGYNNAMRIVRTEGHRIQSASSLDAMYAAKEKGADVVKQWDSTLDGKTRDSHRRLDGQLRELDKDFEVDGKTAPAPGYFSSPKEDCNCRCVLLQRARWALDDDELKTLQERAEYFGLDKSLDFEDFKEKYLKAVDISEDSGIIKTDNKTTAETAVNDVHSVGKIDIEKYKCISNDITTDEVIITDERIQHIHDRHKSDYEEIQPYFQEILSYPDYILEDSSRKNTGLILKQIKENDLKIQMVLRLHTSTDEKGFKNSVISAWKISESRWKNYLKNKKVLYKSE